jgi:hypothetical protein
MSRLTKPPLFAQVLTEGFEEAAREAAARAELSGLKPAGVVQKRGGRVVTMKAAPSGAAADRKAPPRKRPVVA